MLMKIELHYERTNEPAAQHGYRPPQLNQIESATSHRCTIGSTPGDAWPGLREHEPPYCGARGAAAVAEVWLAREP